jgi:hypothetical protein
VIKPSAINKAIKISIRLSPENSGQWVVGGWQLVVERSKLPTAHFLYTACNQIPSVVNFQ